MAREDKHLFSVGHCLHDEMLRHIWETPEGFPWRREELDGWTALAFWDRSLDHRRNSNSAFFWKGDHNFYQMLTEFERVLKVVIALPKERTIAIASMV